jgi:hypothetical protein
VIFTLAAREPADSNGCGALSAPPPPTPQRLDAQRKPSTERPPATFCCDDTRQLTSTVLICNLAVMVYVIMRVTNGREGGHWYPAWLEEQLQSGIKIVRRDLENEEESFPLFRGLRLLFLSIPKVITVTPKTVRWPFKDLL